MNKITIADLSEELQDVINGHTALIDELAKRAGLSEEVRIPAKLNSHSGQREHPDP